MAISIRIVNLDHYMAKPGPLDRSFTPFSDKKLTRVPVIRIFGSTKAGQKICLHIHQVFPYFFVPFDIPREYTTEEQIQKDIFQFGTSLNEALNLAKKNISNEQHIIAIVLTKGIPFYGYHVGYQCYLKIYIANPIIKQQMIDILETEAIMGTRFQPCEAHLNFELQFMMDHNLYGMDWLHIDPLQASTIAARFRLPLPKEPKATYSFTQSPTSTSTINHNILPSFYGDLNIDKNELSLYTSKTVPVDLQSNVVPRESYCELELDITSMSILNRHELVERDIHSSQSKERKLRQEALAHPEEQENKKLFKSLENIWKDEASRRRSRNIMDPIPPVSQIEERQSHTPWFAEPSLRRTMEKMMTEDKFDEDCGTPLMAKVLTVFQAVEAIYPEDYYVFRQHKIEERLKQLQHQFDEGTKDSPTREEAAHMSFPSSPSTLPSIIASVTPVRNNSQQQTINVSATPSRYRDWDLPTQLDKSIINTFIDNASFQEYKEDDIDEIEEFTSTEEEHLKIDKGDDEDDDYFNIDDLSDTDLVQLLENEERKAKKKKRPRVVIEYEEPPVVYQPRRLDFDAESEKLDRILGKSGSDSFLKSGQEQGSSTESSSFTAKRKRKIDVLMKEEEEEDDDDEDKDSDDQSFVISDIPPVPMRRPLHYLKRHRDRINQVDGSGDDDKKEINSIRADRLKTAAEKWEREKRLLKLMKTRKTITLAKHKRDKHDPVTQSSTNSAAGQLASHSQREETKIGQNAEKSQSKSVREFNETSEAVFIEPVVRVVLPKPKKKSYLDHKAVKRGIGVIEKTSLLEMITVHDTLAQPNFRRKRLYVANTFKDNVLEQHANSNQFSSQTVANIETNKNPLHEVTTASEASIINKEAELLTSKITDTKAKQLKDDKNYFRKRLDGMWSDSSNHESANNSREAYSSPPQQPISHSITDNKKQSQYMADDELQIGIDYERSSYPPTAAADTLAQLSLTYSQQEALDIVLNNEMSRIITKEFLYNPPPPVLTEKDIPPKRTLYRDPFYSKESDVPRYPTVFSGKEFRLKSNGTSSLEEFNSTFNIETELDSRKQTRIRTWEPSTDPPSLKQVQAWIKNNKATRPKTSSNSQLTKPSADNTFNFKFNANTPMAKTKRIRDHVDFFSLEIHTNTRESFLPDPQHDPVQLIFWCLKSENERLATNGYQDDYHVGVIAMNDFNISKIGLSAARLDVAYGETEESLFALLIEKIRYYDPDMLVGYEVQDSSWGYLIERGAELGIHLVDELSRVAVTCDYIKKDEWGYKKSSTYRVQGRHLLNVWRLMRSELTLISYTFENVAFNLLHDRVPHYSHATLTSWYLHGAAVLKYRMFKYYMKRVQMNLDMLDESQSIVRACESARVFGVDFYAVLVRGSQYMVESAMFRIAKPENYVLLSPNRQQVASQRSLECLPLIMEPVSQFYKGPMVVLDFQSLYPSIMIAYNICYSTCLGKIRESKESSRFGVLKEFELDNGLLSDVKDHINVTPNGMMFVKENIRKSTLAEMLQELLDTRVMVKRAMKDYKDDTGTLRTLEAKQLTLKFLANVTYGYTSASYSGRMPSAEIADSIVSTGREILERAIKLINETEKWGARVVYGDTDSVFIYFPEKTKEEAFALGNEIAKTVTKLNPKPIKLKFEKVYHPAVLLAKKRYVGFKYEGPGDPEPVFEAKGIETVRRDGTAATQKILESSLKILFQSQDMSELKEFLYRQWAKILSNRVVLQDFIISKEVRMGTYSSRGGPNGAIIANAQMNIDPRAKPQYGERVPYVVVHGDVGARLRDKVVRPEALLANNSLRLDAEYYIRKQIIPPLSRVFNLIGIDIMSWYESMPRSRKLTAMRLPQANELKARNITRIDQYYSSLHCIICSRITEQDICGKCQKTPYNVLFTLTKRQKETQDKFREILLTCQDCSSLSPLDAMTVIPNLGEGQYADVPCDSLDCSIFYQRLKAKGDVQVTTSYNTLLNQLG